MVGHRNRGDGSQGELDARIGDLEGARESTRCFSIASAERRQAQRPDAIAFAVSHHRPWVRFSPGEQPLGSTDEHWA